MHSILGYLDPGAGSMLLQMLLAGILGLGFTIKTYWRKVIAFLRREKKDVPPSANSSTVDEGR